MGVDFQSYRDTAAFGVTVTVHATLFSRYPTAEIWLRYYTVHIHGRRNVNNMSSLAVTREPC